MAHLMYFDKSRLNWENHERGRREKDIKKRRGIEGKLYRKTKGYVVGVVGKINKILQLVAGGNLERQTDRTKKQEKRMDEKKTKEKWNKEKRQNERKKF